MVNLKGLILTSEHRYLSGTVLNQMPSKINPTFINRYKVFQMILILYHKRQNRDVLFDKYVGYIVAKSNLTYDLLFQFELTEYTSYGAKFS
jgi:hypothetical protein